MKADDSGRSDQSALTCFFVRREKYEKILFPRLWEKIEKMDQEKETTQNESSIVSETQANAQNFIFVKYITFLNMVYKIILNLS